MLGQKNWFWLWMFSIQFLVNIYCSRLLFLLYTSIQNSFAFEGHPKQTLRKYSTLYEYYLNVAQKRLMQYFEGPLYVLYLALHPVYKTLTISKYYTFQTLQPSFAHLLRKLGVKHIITGWITSCFISLIIKKIFLWLEVSSSKIILYRYIRHDWLYIGVFTFERSCLSLE